VALPKDPSIPEFYVYRLEVEGIPFYVGVGRSARASDRVRYVQYLMTREAKGKPVKWGLSASAIAGLLRAGCEVEVVYATTGCTRTDALKVEMAEITRLIAEGTMLANIQHNTARPRSSSDVIQAVLSRLRKAPPSIKVGRKTA
jgi:hypothetical protein